MPVKPQLMKWYLPAIALILGYYWYRRRGRNKLDPGEKNSCEENKSDQVIACEQVRESLPSPDTTEKDKIDDTLVKTPMSLPMTMKSETSVEQVQTCLENRNENFPEVGTETPNLGDIRGIDEAQNDTVIDPPSNLENVEKVEVKDGGTGGEEEEGEKKKEENTEGSKIAVGKNAERDSANHSPVSNALEGSVTDEVRSEGSTDSGKGGSLHALEAQTAEAQITMYAFEIPKHLVGRLYGKKGCMIQGICRKSPEKMRFEVIDYRQGHGLAVIHGTENSINVALQRVQRLFPKSRYPDFSIDSWFPDKVWKTRDNREGEFEYLVHGVYNNVQVCHINMPNNLSLHFAESNVPKKLEFLGNMMKRTYSQMTWVPVELVCDMEVAVNYNEEEWARGLIQFVDPKGEENLVKLLDFGGTVQVDNFRIRELYPQFKPMIMMPHKIGTYRYQAMEVVLENVRPVKDEWPLESFDIIKKICSTYKCQTCVTGYTHFKVPIVKLILTVPNYGKVDLVDELVARGFAEHMT